jgi:hemoglobin
VAETPSSYEWGGGKAIARMIDCFYDRVESDELIAPLFPDGVSREHRDHVAVWWQEVFGGPPATATGSAATPRWSTSTGTFGSRSTSGGGSWRRCRWRPDDAGLPDDPEFPSALLAYLEWGTRQALQNSQPGPRLWPRRRCPGGGWGEAPP